MLWLIFERFLFARFSITYVRFKNVCFDAEKISEDTAYLLLIATNPLLKKSY